jgi:hypothetical protein
VILAITKSSKLKYPIRCDSRNNTAASPGEKHPEITPITKTRKEPTTPRKHTPEARNLSKKVQKIYH